MADFDPDKFLQETSSPMATATDQGGFDPDQFIAETGGTPQPQQQQPAHVQNFMQKLSPLLKQPFQQMQSQISQAGAEYSKKPDWMTGAAGAMKSMAAVGNVPFNIAGNIVKGVTPQPVKQFGKDIIQGAGIVEKQAAEQYAGEHPGLTTEISATAETAGKQAEAHPEMANLLGSAANLGLTVASYPGVGLAAKMAGKAIEPATEAVGKRLTEKAQQVVAEEEAKKTLSRGRVTQLKPPSQPGVGPKVFEEFRLTPPDRTALTISEKKSSVPFTDFTLAERNRMEIGDINPTTKEVNPSAFQLYGTKELNPALERLDQHRSAAGKKLSEVIQQHAEEPIDISDVKKSFEDKAKQVLGVQIQPETKELTSRGSKIIQKTKPAQVVAAENRIPTNPEFHQAALDINNLLSDPAMTVQKAQDIKQRLDNMIWEKTANGYVKNSRLDALVKPIRKQLDTKIGEIAGQPYHDANLAYSKAKSVHDEFYKRMGPETDIKMNGVDEPLSRHAASIAKRAVQSNADSNVQAILKKVSELLPDTDLLSGAKRAEIAMRLANDAKAARGVAVPESKAGIIRAMAKGAGKVYGKFTGDPIEHAERFYIKNKIRRKDVEKVIGGIKGEPTPIPELLPIAPTAAPHGSMQTQVIKGVPEQFMAAQEQSRPLQLLAKPRDEGYIDLGEAGTTVALPPTKPQVPAGTQQVIDRMKAEPDYRTPEQQAQVKRFQEERDAAEKALEEQKNAKSELYPDQPITPDELIWKKNNLDIDFFRKHGIIWDEGRKKYVFNTDPNAVAAFWDSFGHPGGPEGREISQRAADVRAEFEADRASDQLPRSNEPAQVSPAENAPSQAGEVAQAAPESQSETSPARPEKASSEDWHENPEVNKAALAYELKRELETAIKRQPDGKLQWKLVTGQITRDKQGNLVAKSPLTVSLLEGVRDYYNQTEGLSAIQEHLGGKALFEDADGVADFIANAKTAKEIREMRKGAPEPEGDLQQDYEAQQAEKAAHDKSLEEQGDVEAGRSLFDLEPGAVSISGNKGKRDVLKQLTTPQKDYEDVAITDSPSRGFLLPSGEYLDIGGQDHRYINGMVDYGKKQEDYYYNGRGSRSEKMFQIMKDSGAIRYIPESNQFQILSRPTGEQLKQIEQYVKEHGSVDIEIGENANARTYNEDDIYNLSDDISQTLEGQRPGNIANSTLGLLGRSAGGAAVGAGVGQTQGKTPAERRRNALIGAIAGGAAGVSPELVRAMRGEAKGGLADVVKGMKGNKGQI